MNELNLLMVHADDPTPALDPVPAEGVQAAAIDDAMPDHLWDEGGDPTDLFLQRWGVVAPTGERGDRLLALVQPLVARRQEQQQGEPVKIYRVPAVMTALEAGVWKKTAFRTQADLDIDIPRYLLLLGDLHELSLSLQQILSTDCFVGRLAFDCDEHYAAYVHKVLRWEDSPADQREGRAILHTVHDGTSATRVGFDSLMKPGADVLKARMERGQINADRVDTVGDLHLPDPDELLTSARTDRPGVLFSLSHGEGPPRTGWRTDEAQRDGQGAMSFGRQGRLRGEDVAAGSFMPGGVWFMLACFSAGSPLQSAYAPWLDDLRSMRKFKGDPRAVVAALPKDRPFIAALPKAALANPEGPLGFYGHIDLAWTYSFQELDQGRVARPAKFMGVIHALLKRDRLGIGHRELVRYQGQADSELMMLQEELASGQCTEIDKARNAHLWMLRQDLGAYILLGDPAARLPLQAKEATQAAPVPRSAVQFREASELPLDLERLEEAIGKVLVGDESIKAISEAYGISRDALRDAAETYRQAGRRALKG